MGSVVAAAAAEHKDQGKNDDPGAAVIEDVEMPERMRGYTLIETEPNSASKFHL